MSDKQNKKITFMQNIPNLISAFRILLVVVFAILFVNKRYIYCIAVYVFAFLSDILDGYIARKNNWITSLGKLLDPLADKLMLLTALVCFSIEGWVPVWITVFIMLKEVLLCLFGSILYVKKMVVEADLSGKAATGLWTLAVLSVLLQNYYTAISAITSILIICAFVVSILAALNYSFRYLILPSKPTKEE